MLSYPLGFAQRLFSDFGYSVTNRVGIGEEPSNLYFVVGGVVDSLVPHSPLTSPVPDPGRQVD
jgi:hypothetical protein